MRKLDFIKTNPAGNITIFIEKYDVYAKDIMKISEKIMSELSLGAEQVGFIRENHLQMMGGEFCGNASRAFAALLAFRDEKFKVQKDYFITCSGENKKLKVDVREGTKKNEFLAKIEMPRFLEIKEITFENEKLTLVEFSGIKHFIYEGVQNKEEIIRFLKNFLSKENYSAFGVMFFDLEKMFMQPYVYVNGFANGVWENSCASGTTALGFYLKRFKKIEKAKIYQPNGWLEFSFKEDKIYIDGPVEIVAEGKVYV